MSPDRIIELLGLEPHPEGGRFAETWVGEAVRGRAAGTAIYFLLAADEVSHWHRVDAAEVWHHYGGSPLELSTAADPERPEVDVHRLGAWRARGFAIVERLAEARNLDGEGAGPIDERTQDVPAEADVHPLHLDA